MDISNRSLVLLLVITVFLVVAAALLTFGSQLAKHAPAVVTPSVVDLNVEPEVHRSGGTRIKPEGPLTVELEPGVDAQSATIQCDMYKAERPLIDGGFGFESIPFGNCEITLSGATSAYGPVFPGDELKCLITDGHTACTGGAASDLAGTVSVKSELPGYLQVDGDTIGALPVDDLKMKVGKRQLAVLLNDGRTIRWTLSVQPQETIKLMFPSPDAPGTVPAPPAVPPQAPAPAPMPDPVAPPPSAP